MKNKEYRYSRDFAKMLVLHRFGEKREKSRGQLILGIAILVFCVGVLPLAAADPHSTGIFRLSTGSMRDDLQTAAEEKKTLVVYYWLKGCPYCARMEREVFTQKLVKKIVKQHLYMVDVNVRGQKSLEDFKGRALDEKRFAGKHNVQFTPTIIYYDRNAREIYRTSGFQKRSHFIAAAQYVAAGHYKRMSFNDFLNRVWPKRRG